MVTELHKLGFQDIFLWVLEENLRARKFYEKCGFTSAGRSMEYEIGGKMLREMQYCYKR
ncbi:N-acetyltransferase [bacterium 0.1xD8-71]|nr:N-acetyltransferase [bacterium 0.1xD8-71]